MFPNLNAEIARKGMTRTELAQKANMSVSNLSLKLSGKVKFSFEDTLNIKEALGVDIPVETLFIKAV